MNVLIVDDEPLARQRLQRMVDKLADFSVCGLAENGEQALAMYEQLGPDIVLLDIRMPGVDGLEVAEAFANFEQSPAIIFCTAYDHYALEAFSASAVDYLVKPVAADKLAASLRKATSLNKAQVHNMQQSMPASQSNEEHLTVKYGNEVRLIPLAEVSHFIAEQKYVTAYFSDGEALLDESLKQLEDKFASHLVRVHRNALVTVSHIVGLHKEAAGSYRVLIKGNIPGPQISRRHYASVRKLLDTL